MNNGQSVPSLHARCLCRLAPARVTNGLNRNPRKVSTVKTGKQLSLVVKNRVMIASCHHDESP